MCTIGTNCTNFVHTSSVSSISLLSFFCRGLKLGTLLFHLDYLMPIEGSSNFLLIKIETSCYDGNRDDNKHHNEDDGGGGSADAITCCWYCGNQIQTLRIEAVVH